MISKAFGTAIPSAGKLPDRDWRTKRRVDAGRTLAAYLSKK
jgi:hypothetical protein